ncbi:MAG: TonB family protein [Myxococcales bacterium]|nr:TonB family protein [Myxococcales bacterium]
MKKSCSGLGLPGMKVTVTIAVKPSGKVRSVTPVGSRAGSSLGRCVVKAAKRARFPKTRAGASYTTSFSL